eukprot:scaffold41187_cov303-Isochrysis_galbana.AAC.5
MSSGSASAANAATSFEMPPTTDSPRREQYRMSSCERERRPSVRGMCLRAEKDATATSSPPSAPRLPPPPPSPPLPPSAPTLRCWLCAGRWFASRNASSVAASMRLALVRRPNSRLVRPRHASRRERTMRGRSLHWSSHK